MSPRRSSLRAAALAASLALAPLAARSEEARAGATSEPPEDAVTLTVRGGVSLGAYEAGLTWGLVRFLKAARASGRHETLLRPRLAAVSGASAGAVNAFLAAAIWCERLDLDRGIDDNLLRDAWRELDLDGFLPRAAGGYADGDGLLAAAPLDQTGRRLSEAIFGAGASGRFAPGCRVPVGITVTPFEPVERGVAGLTVTTQRLVVPWLLEVGADGAVTIRRQPLPKGELSESVLDLAGVPRAGEAAPSRPEVVVEALLASAAVPLAFAPRRLCATVSPAEAERTGSPESCADYVDGGVFDNAPVGLAVDLGVAAGGGTVLHPMTSFLIDPERRRLEPRPGRVEQADGGYPTLGRQLRLFGNLLATARGAELTRTIRSRGWNRTTQRLLRDFATAAADVAEVHATVAHLSARPAPEPGVAVSPEATTTDRATFGRALSACLEKLTEDVVRGAGGTHRCARDVPALQLAGPAPGDERLPPGEVVRLAARLAGLLRAAHQARAGAASDAALVTSVRALEAGTSLVATTLLLLADEVDRVAASGLSEAKLLEFRDAVLEPVRRSVGFPRATNLLLASLLGAELERMEHVAPPGVAAEARRARGELAALPPGAPFGLDLLAGVGAASADAVARGAWTPADSAAAWHPLITVVEARTRFVEISTRIAALRQQAIELGDGSATEHRLEVSSRFAPLAGSQLSGFAGFLDGPLRLHDYYVGVYEATHAIAVALCTNDPPESGDALPARLAGDPSEIDLTAPSSQRCIGEAMRRAVELLGVRSSPRGRHVISTLAGLELAASLGRASRALILRREPAWAWLDELAAPSPGDPVLATLEALTDARTPCRAGDEEPLCLPELSFDAFLGALRAHGYRPGSAGLAQALRDAPLFWADTSERLAARALAVERRAVGSEPGPLSRTVMVALSAGQLLAGRAAERGPAPRLLLDPSTVPDAPVEGQPGWRRMVAHAIPYRLSLDVARGGFSLAWLEPELLLRRWLSIRATLEPVGYRSGSGWTSAAGALLVGHAGGFSLGAGPRWWLDWRGGSGLGVEARVFALQDRFALGVGMREPGDAGRGWLVTLAVADLNGLAFWLSPLGGAR